MNDEALEVIASTHTGTLASLTKDGAPYSTPITYTFTDGRFVWKSAPDAVHSLNLDRDHRASLSIIENGEGEPRAVYINGSAKATGETSFNAQWGQTIADYEMFLGELDKDHSTQGRFYFRGGSK